IVEVPLTLDHQPHRLAHAPERSFLVVGCVCASRVALVVVECLLTSEPRGSDIARNAALPDLAETRRTHDRAEHPLNRTVGAQMRSLEPGEHGLVVEKKMHTVTGDLFDRRYASATSPANATHCEWFSSTAFNTPSSGRAATLGDDGRERDT